MKINFYFLFPNGFTAEDVDNFDLSQYGEYPGGWFINIAMIELYRSLKKANPDVEITPINSYEVMGNYCCCNKYNIAIPIIENPDTGKHMAISYCDKNMWIKKDNGWEDFDNCVELFAVGGIHIDDVTYDYFEPRIKYTPCVSSTWHYLGYKEIMNLRNQNIEKTIPEKPVFVGGGPWNFRRYIIDNDQRFNYIQQPLYPDAFMQYMSKYSIHIDFNGGAEVSNRTFDAFGLGAALVRPALKIQYHNKLIPGHHYAEVPCSDFSDYKTLADAYIDTFEKVKNDNDYRVFLSENGKKYWEDNCTMESYVRIFTELINLNKLK